MSLRSTIATRRPSFAAAIAAFWPPGPEPITRMSKSYTTTSVTTERAVLNPRPPPGPGGAVELPQDSGSIYVPLPRRPVRGTLRLPQGVHPFRAGQQPGGPGRPARAAGRDRHRHTGRHRVVGGLVDDEHVVVPERVTARQDLGAQRVQRRPDRLDPVLRLLDLGRHRLRG